LQMSKTQWGLVCSLQTSVTNKPTLRDEKKKEYFQCAPANSIKCRLKKSNKMHQYVDIYLLLNYSICFGRPSRPSSGAHETVVAASGTDHTMWGASSTDNLICTRGCNYNFMYSWWWARWTSETCRVI
jgi:hypothetical protein